MSPFASVLVNAHLLMPPFAFTTRLRLWALSGFLACLLAVMGVNAWRLAGLQALARDWQQAHTRKDLPALEALYCWEGVDPSLRAKMQEVFRQEFEIAVRSVTAEPASKIDLFLAETQRPNLEPTGVVVVQFQSSDGLGARLIAGGSWSHPKFIVYLPVPAPLK
jgi:hypothetical protein